MYFVVRHISACTFPFIIIYKQWVVQVVVLLMAASRVVAKATGAVARVAAIV
jgi:hypothetical protein